MNPWCNRGATRVEMIEKVDKIDYLTTTGGGHRQ